MPGLRTPSVSTASPARLSHPAATGGFAVWLLLAATVAAASADTLRGRVVDPDGKPVARASISVSGAFAATLTATTDDAGTFAVEVPGEGLVDVKAWTNGLEGGARRVAVNAGALEITLAVRAVNESVTVTASHVGVLRSTLADSVTVLSRAELEDRQITNLGDALRLVPGLTIARNGGPGTVTSVFPRGGESDFTMVLVDGVRANAFGGGMDLSQVPLADVERIEVVRGPQSALHGSDAIGGVIHVITAEPGPLVATVDGEVGGRDSKAVRGSVRGAARGWFGQLTAGDMRDDGFTGTAPADGTTVTNDDSRTSDAGVSAGWRHGSGVEIGGTAQYVETERGSPGPYGSNPAGNFSGVDRDSRSLTRRRIGAAHLVAPLGGASSRARLRADADTADHDLEFRSAFGSTGETRRTHGRVELDTALDAGLSFSAGGDWVRESGRSTFITAASGAVPVERGVLAGFGEIRWQPAARLALTAGARAERISRDALAADPFAFTPRPAFPEDTVTSVDPKVTVAFTAVPERVGGASTRLRASAGTGIRPPDAFEIAFTDNDGLRPERSRSVEAGITQTLAHGAVQIDATWFHNAYDDLIISVGRFSSSSRYRTDNIANARARGIELALAARPIARVSARATYTFLDSEILAVDGADGQAPAPFVPGDRLLRRPRHQGSADVTWTLGRVQAFGVAELRGTTLDVEPNFGTFGGLFENEGHTVVSAGGSVTLRGGISVHARVANLFDRSYEDTLGYPAWGRTAYVGVRIAARR